MASGTSKGRHLALIHGDDAFLVEQAAQSLIQGWRSALVSEFGYERLDWLRLDSEALAQALGQEPFLDPYRVVHVTNLAPQRSRGPVKALVALLPRLDSSVRLLLTASGQLERGHPLLGLFADTGTVSLFPRLKPSQLRDWAWRRAQELGMRLNPQSMAVLLASTPGDLRMIDGELLKLSVLASSGAELTAAVVADLLAGGREEDVFGLEDEFLPRPTAGAWRLLDELLSSSSSATGLAYRMARRCSWLLEIRGLLSRGYGLEQIQAELGGHPFRVSKAVAQARTVPDARLEFTLGRLLDYEWQVKSGQVDAEWGLRRLMAVLAL